MPARWVVQEVLAALAGPLAAPAGVTRCRKILIFDGYPRTMSDLLEFEDHTGVSAAVLSDEESRGAHCLP